MRKVSFVLAAALAATSLFAARFKAEDRIVKFMTAAK